MVIDDLARLAFDPFITDKEIMYLKTHLQKIIDGLDGLMPKEEDK